MKHRSDSLEEINTKFVQILQKLGMDASSKSRLEQKLSPSAKMNMIVSIQSQSVKEGNIKNSVDVLRGEVSLYYLFLLRSTLEEGPSLFYEILKKNEGVSAIEHSLVLLLYYDCVKDASYEFNKELYESNKDLINDYDPELYVFERRCNHTSYNASKINFSIFSRESVLEEYLNLIFVIISTYKESLRDFDIEKITRSVNLHRCYTKSFYDIIDFYASNDLSLLDFLFAPLNSKYHLCLVNTFVYDIYKDEADYTAIKIMQMCGKYQRVISYMINQINYEKQMGLGMNQKPSEKTADSQAKSLTINFVNIMNDEINLGPDVNKELIKQRINQIIDTLATSTTANTLPCLIESFLTNPMFLSDKLNEIKLKNELENLKRENERLQIAVVNMDNKSDIDLKKEIVENIRPTPIIQKKEDMNLKDIVTKKTNNLTIRKPPPFAKKKAKETNPLLAPYFSRSYYPLRWAKMNKGENIWDDVHKTMKINDILDNFTISNLLCYEKKTVVIEKPPTTKVQVPTVFPGKRGNAIGIALGRLRISDSDFKNKIFSYDTESISENIIKQLIHNYPTNEEFRQLQIFQEEMVGKSERIIGRAEEFYFNFLDCHEEFIQRLNAMYFKITFPGLSSSIRIQIKKITNIYSKGIESMAIKEFLQYALLLGNIFNGSSFIGNAEGFSLSSIYQIVKYTGNAKESLLSDIAEKMTHNLTSDLEYLTSENVKYESVCTEVAELNINYDRLKNYEDLKILWPDLFCDYANLVEEIKNLNWLHGKFCKYFGEDDVFVILRHLLEAIKK